jgi:uncharacterized protein (DUF1330 family)
MISYKNDTPVLNCLYKTVAHQIFIGPFISFAYIYYTIKIWLISNPQHSYQIFFHMSCYFIAQINIHDQEEYKRYLDRFDEVFEKFQGEIIIVEEKPTILEGQWDYSRIVIFRFPSEEEANRWYYSIEYQSIIEFRLNASDGTVLFVNEKER